MLYEKREDVDSSMIDDLVTIVAPVYNVSEYLEEMLKGIQCQTYKNWELILVDDGSTDDSGVICDDFCRQEPRAKVIHQENRGQGSARDAAIAISRGRWLAFVDADDVAHIDYIERMVSTAHLCDVEIVECDFVEFSGPTPVFSVGRKGVVKIVRGCESVAQIALDCQTRAMTLWCKLFRAELFNGVRCPEGQLYEDEYLIPRLYAAAKSYCLLADRLYLYRIRQGSTMTQSYDRRRALANIEVLEDRFKLFYGRFGLETDSILSFRHCMSMCTVLERIRSSACARDLGGCASYCMKEIRDKGVRCIGFSRMPIKRKILVAIAIMSPKMISFLRSARRGVSR